jgi:hypothetical protein
VVTAVAVKMLLISRIEAVTAVPEQSCTQAVEVMQVWVAAAVAVLTLKEAVGALADLMVELLETVATRLRLAQAAVAKVGGLTAA